MILREYQTQAVQSVLREFESVRSTLAVLATGTGKSPIALAVAKTFANKGDNVIFLAHREELLDQARKMAQREFDLECELELGTSRASEMFNAPMLLASIQTMISGRKDARRMHKFSPYNYGLVVIDETHHAPAASYREVLDYLQGNKDIKLLGITATPNRSDEEALGEIFESVAFDYPAIQAIKDGYLVPIQQQLINIQSLDFSHVRTTAGDLNAGDLAAVMEAERNLYGICDAAIKEARDQKAVMFCVTVRHAQMCADILNRYRQGIAIWASGKTPKDDRRRIIRDYREGRYQYFVNVDLVGEGTDFPDVSLLIDGAPTKSTMRYQQRLGRIMRPLPGIVDGVIDRRAAIAASAKPVATVIDFVGNAGKHKLIHAVDILGGKISPKARELAERKLRESGQPARIDELVIEAERKEREDAQRAEAARKAMLTARATYTIRHIDPFDSFDLVRPPDRAWDRGKQLSQKQRALLVKQSIDPDRLSYAEGKTALNALFSRWSNGLCSLKQAALLKRFGYESNVTREEAGAIITQLKDNGWQRHTHAS